MSETSQRKVPCAGCGHPADWYHPGPVLHTLFIVPFTNKKFQIILYDERERDSDILCFDCLHDYHNDHTVEAYRAGREDGAREAEQEGRFFF